jgi:hypothetical protein
MQIMNKISFAVLTALVSTVMVTPSVSHAQATISIGGGGGTIQARSVKVEKDEAGKPGSVSADSFTVIRNFAKNKQPVIVINGMVADLKALNALEAKQITSIKLQEGEAEVKHYGKQAENGVLIVRTGKDSGEKEKDGPKEGTLKLKDGQSGEFKGNIKIRTQ